jgi:uracil phosphoribosyltransferase
MFTRGFVVAGITERVWTAATNVAEVAVGTVGMAVDTVTGKARVHAQSAPRNAMLLTVGVLRWLLTSAGTAATAMHKAKDTVDAANQMIADTAHQAYEKGADVVHAAVGMGAVAAEKGMFYSGLAVSGPSRLDAVQISL